MDRKVPKKKSPNQENRDLDRSSKKKNSKFEKQNEINDSRNKNEDTENIVEKKTGDTNDKVVELARDIKAGEVTEKVFVVAKGKIDNHNIGIEYDIKSKLEAKGVKVRKVFIEREGILSGGEYVRSIVLIEQTAKKTIEQENFDIENYVVLIGN